MPLRVQIHPTARIAAVTLCCGILAVSVLVISKRASRNSVALQQAASDDRAAKSQSGDVVSPSEVSFQRDIGDDLIIPVVMLKVPDTSAESNWSRALAARFGGETETQVEGGRIDVVTEHYAIEVDRWEKWHESIGQAAHYAMKSNKLPVAAIIVPSDIWPLTDRHRDRLLLIDETCLKQGIKLVLLRRTTE